MSCRICQIDGGETLYKACDCNAVVHQSCLQSWISHKWQQGNAASAHCEVCKVRYHVPEAVQDNNHKRRCCHFGVYVFFDMLILATLLGTCYYIFGRLLISATTPFFPDYYGWSVFVEGFLLVHSFLSVCQLIYFFFTCVRGRRSPDDEESGSSCSCNMDCPGDDEEGCCYAICCAVLLLPFILLLLSYALIIRDVYHMRKRWFYKHEQTPLLPV